MKPLGLLLLAALVVLSLPATAQVRRPPAATDPGRVPQRFERPPEPRATREADERAGIEAVGPPPGAEQVRFVLRSVELEGNTVLSDEELSSAWAEHLSTEISLKTLYEIAASVTARYRNSGYVLSRAIVPPHDVTDGVGRLRVIEGYIAEVVIEGDQERRSGLFAHRAEEIKASRPTQAKVLERYLLLMNDLPGVYAEGVLRPSQATPGASDLVVTLHRTPIQAYLDMNNRGTRYLGRYQWEAGGTFNSLFGLFDQTQIRVSNTFNRELTFVALDHSQTVGGEGTTLFAGGSYVYQEPGSTLRQIELDGESLAGSFGVLHPLIRSRGRNLSVAARFDILNSETSSVDDVIDVDDKVRALRFSASYDFVDRFDGVNLVFLELSQGLNVLDATSSSTDQASRPGAEPDFTKLFLRTSRLQRLASKLSLLAQANGQYSFDELLSPEEFGYGGEDFGRGYDNSEFTGDSGVATLLELQYGDVIGRRYLQSYQVYGFGDYGFTWSREELGDSGQSTSACSAGVGARLNLTHWLSARLELAQPICERPVIDNDDGDRNPRFFFGASARY